MVCPLPFPIHLYSCLHTTAEDVSLSDYKQLPLDVLKQVRQEVAQMALTKAASRCGPEVSHLVFVFVHFSYTPVTVENIYPGCHAGGDSPHEASPPGGVSTAEVLPHPTHLCILFLQ